MIVLNLFNLTYDLIIFNFLICQEVGSGSSLFQIIEWKDSTTQYSELRLDNLFYIFSSILILLFLFQKSAGRVLI